MRKKNYRNGVLLLAVLISVFALLYYCYSEWFHGNKTQFREYFRYIKSLSKRISILKRTIKSLQYRKPLLTPIKVLAKNLKSDVNRNLYVANKIESDRLCALKTFKVFILVVSNVYNVRIRNQIRKTWGYMKVLKLANEKRVLLNWKTMFVIGKPMVFSQDIEFVQEQSLNSDILEVNYMDIPSFSPLILLNAIEFLSFTCMFDYLMVMNDHQFLNVQSLFLLIH